jgi:glycerophosphoryl diester phosphodiesterase
MFSRTQAVARAFAVWLLVILSAFWADVVTAQPAGGPNSERPPSRLWAAPGSKLPAEVIAHRGSSLERPEHTLAAYQLAIEQGADYLEPDLRLTRDGILIALHDTTLNRTTDVADRPEFAGRARLDGRNQPAWYPEDFLLEEIKRVRAKQGTKGRSAEFDGRESIPTFSEVVALARRYQEQSGRPVGLVPELRGSIAEFVKEVRALQLDQPDSDLKLYLQSFSLDDLRAARAELGLPAAWLVTKWPPAETLPKLRKEITGLGANKRLLLAADGAEQIARAKEAGLQIIAWTFADDNFDRQNFPSAAAELQAVLDRGVDAFFTDSPASGKNAVK